MRFVSKIKTQLFQPSTTNKAILFQLFQPNFSKTPFSSFSHFSSHCSQLCSDSINFLLFIKIKNFFNNINYFFEFSFSGISFMLIFSINLINSLTIYSTLSFLFLPPLNKSFTKDDGFWYFGI